MSNLKIVYLASCVLLSSNVTFASNADDRYIYFGGKTGRGYAGFPTPLVTKFIHSTDQGDVEFGLGNSNVYGMRFGYGFYPKMSIEFAVTHQSKYRLSYKLPNMNIDNTEDEDKVIEPITDSTSILANLVMLNFVYEMDKKAFGLKPYAVFGAGIARMTIDPIDTKSKNNANILQFLRTVNHSVVYQFGGGLIKDITNNVSVNLGVRFQVENNIGIKYKTINSKEPTAIDKIIGIAEFTVGFIVKIPL